MTSPTPIAAVIGGGTVFHLRPHLSLAAPAYGGTARAIAALLDERHADRGYRADLHLTRMAGGASLETNEDVARLLDRLVADPAVRMIFLSAALCDFEGGVVGPSGPTPSGKAEPRLHIPALVALEPARKLVGAIRRERKDIFLVAFKTTAGADQDEQFCAGLTLLKQSSANLVLANDLHTRLNMVITPELSRYAVTRDRDQALAELVDIAVRRAGLTFARTRVVEGELLPWGSRRIPPALGQVVDHCAGRGAYRPFRGVTVGHFGFLERDGSTRLWSSRRKQDFNTAGGRALVEVTFDEAGAPTAAGAKPSAGVRSQYEVLRRFPGFDCIVHFHCPARSDAPPVVPVRPQRDLECGSHECGDNTWRGIELFGAAEAGAPDLGAVMLDRHGPNVIFRSSTDPSRVIDFIERHFDLTRATSDEGRLPATGA